MNLLSGNKRLLALLALPGALLAPSALSQDPAPAPSPPAPPADAPDRLPEVVVSAPRENVADVVVRDE